MTTPEVERPKEQNPAYEGRPNLLFSVGNHLSAATIAASYGGKNELELILPHAWLAAWREIFLLGAWFSGSGL